MQAQEDQRCADRVLPDIRHGIFLIDTGSAVIFRRCHLGEKACVSNFAHAPTRRRGNGRGRPRRGSGQANERKVDEEEARREVDTRARTAENRGNAYLSCYRVLASRASEYPTYMYIQGSPSGCV